LVHNVNNCSYLSDECSCRSSETDDSGSWLAFCHPQFIASWYPGTEWYY